MSTSRHHSPRRRINSTPRRINTVIDTTNFHAVFFLSTSPRFWYMVTFQTCRYISTMTPAVDSNPDTHSSHLRTPTHPVVNSSHDNGAVSIIRSTIITAPFHRVVLRSRSLCFQAQDLHEFPWYFSLRQLFHKVVCLRSRVSARVSP
jgi:hypothetical protein